MLGGRTVVNVRLIGRKDEELITPEEVIARDQTDWERVDQMTDEELTQNALDDPDNRYQPFRRGLLLDHSHQNSKGRRE